MMEGKYYGRFLGFGRPRYTLIVVGIIGLGIHRLIYCSIDDFNNSKKS